MVKKRKKIAGANAVSLGKASTDPLKPAVRKSSSSRESPPSPKRSRVTTSDMLPPPHPTDANSSKPRTRSQTKLSDQGSDASTHARRRRAQTTTPPTRRSQRLLTPSSQDGVSLDGSFCSSIDNSENDNLSEASVEVGKPSDGPVVDWELLGLGPSAASVAQPSRALPLGSDAPATASVPTKRSTHRRHRKNPIASVKSDEPSKGSGKSSSGCSRKKAQELVSSGAALPAPKKSARSRARKQEDSDDVGPKPPLAASPSCSPSTSNLPGAKRIVPSSKKAGRGFQKKTPSKTEELCQPLASALTMPSKSGIPGSRHVTKLDFGTKDRQPCEGPAYGKGLLKFGAAVIKNPSTGDPNGCLDDGPSTKRGSLPRTPPKNSERGRKVDKCRNNGPSDRLQGAVDEQDRQHLHSSQAEFNPKASTSSKSQMPLDGEGDAEEITAEPGNAMEAQVDEFSGRLVELMDAVVLRTVAQLAEPVESFGVHLNLPQYVDFSPFQDRVQTEADGRGFDVLLVTANRDLCRLQGNVNRFQDFLDAAGPDDDRSQPRMSTSQRNLLKQSAVFIVDGCERIDRESWQKFCENISLAKYGNRSVDLTHRVVVVALSDAENIITHPDDFLQDEDFLRVDANIQNENVNHPVGRITYLFEKYCDAAEAKEDSSNKGDSLIHVIAEHHHDIRHVVSHMQAYAEDLNVLTLTCYNPSSFRLPRAENLYDFISLGGVTSSPDDTPRSAYTMVTDKTLRRLKNVDVVIIDGGELLSAHAANKLSRALNIAKGMDEGEKKMFGSAVVVIFTGDRDRCLQQNFTEDETFHRGVRYAFRGEPAPRIPTLSYVLPASDNEASDKLRDLELRELKDTNCMREDVICARFAQSFDTIVEIKQQRDREQQLPDIETEHHQGNRVVTATGPYFIPLTRLVDRVSRDAAEKGLRELRLTCYSSPSERVPTAVNLYDFIAQRKVPRRPDYRPPNNRVHLFPVDDARNKLLAAADLIVIDGYENLSDYAVATLNANINAAKNIPMSSINFGSAAVLMVGGLQNQTLNSGAMFEKSELFRHFDHFDFSTFPRAELLPAGIPLRGQSQSPERSMRGRCVPPVRGTGPSGRGSPRGGTYLRSASPSPTRAGERNVAPPRTRRSTRKINISTVILERVDEVDHSASPSEQDDSGDEDYVPADRGRNREQGQQPAFFYPSSLQSNRAKENYRKARRTGTFKVACDNLHPKVPYKSFGILGTEECSECGAYFFEGEGIKGKRGVPGFLQCCQHGKVSVDPPDIPPVIDKLLDKKNKKHKHFMEEVRTYNNYFALAAFRGSRVGFKEKFPYVFKIHGQAQVLLPQATPPDPMPGEPRTTLQKEQRLMFNQLLICDPADAKKEREGFKPNRRLDPGLVLDFEKHFKKENVLYGSFDMMGVWIRRANREYQEKTGLPAPNVTLVFKRKNVGTAAPRGVRFRPTDGSHPAREEEPVADGEIAAVFNANGRPENVPLYVMHKGTPYKMEPTNPLREPLVYPFIYSDGRPKWYREDKHQGPRVTQHNNKVTLREYYSYILHLRQRRYAQRLFGKLTQQWIVDGWVRVEDNDLNFIRNCEYLRSSTRPRLTEFLTNLARDEGLDLGREIKLPSSFSHSPGQMRKYYMNSLQMCRELGFPDLFVTITMNPKSQELKDDPKIDTKDLSLNTAEVCRLFWRKIDHFIRMVRDQMIFGICVGIVLVIEFQKRGLPHAHALITLAEKVQKPEHVDKFCTTMIPDPRKDKELYDLVTTMMVHQTCGPRCMRKNKCSKGYPMPFREETCMNDGRGFIAIKRPNDGRTFDINDKTYDRRSIVPYNPYLLKVLGCHCNIVPVNSLKQVSYIFKYIFKGGDLAQLELKWQPNTYKIKNPSYPRVSDILVASTNRVGADGRPMSSRSGETATPLPPDGPQPRPVPPDGALRSNSNLDGDPGQQGNQKEFLEYDEATFYQMCRYVTSMEATWRLLALPLFYFSHKVVPLSVHLEGENPIVFKKGEAVAAAAREVRDSNLTAYFKLVRESREKPVNDPERIRLQTVLYAQIPKHYVWMEGTREWKKRTKTNKPNLGRLYDVKPNAGERFFLRILLQEVPGCASFEDLRTYLGETYTSFKEACKARNLLRDDKAYLRCMKDMATGATAYQLRLTFSLLLTYCDVTAPEVIFDLHWRQMSEFWLRTYTEDQARLFCRAWIKQRVEYSRGDGTNEFFDGIDATLEVPEEFSHQEDLPSREEADSKLAALNADQRKAAEAVLAASKRYTDLRDRLSGGFVVPQRSSVFLVEGPAGTGKTTTYKAIHSSLKADGETVICMAFTGSAACLLPEGRTCHNCLRLPVPLNEESTSALEPGFEQWKLLQRAALIVIDEVAMAPSVIFSIMDDVLRRIFDAEEPEKAMFAGKVVLFGGDMRQIGPIPGDGQTMAQVHFRNSPSFLEAERLLLNINMRADKNEAKFASFLRAVGEGKANAPRSMGLPARSVVIPSSYVIQNYKLQDLIDWTFEGDPSRTADGRAILTPYNVDCFRINDSIVESIHGDTFRALSEDTIADDSSTSRLMAPSRTRIESDEALEVDTATVRRLVHQDELNMIVETGLPPHVLLLKKGAIVVLIRNLDVRAGLVNGCRMRVLFVNRDRLQVEIISDFPNIVEKVVTLPRIKFTHEVHHAFVLQRVQFPVRLAFAMTINKAQGLTLDKVGIYLPDSLSDHGKLYVAMSRVRRPEDVKMILIDSDDSQGFHRGHQCWFTKNRVDRQLWDLTEAVIEPLPVEDRPLPPMSHVYASDLTADDDDVPLEEYATDEEEPGAEGC